MERLSSDFADGRRGEQVEFIHQEVYVDNDPDKGIRKPLRAFGLPTEPWLFTVDRNGKVAARLEGSFGFNAFEQAIRAALQPERILAGLGRQSYVRTDVATMVRVAREPDTCELLCLDLPKAETARAGLPPAAELEARAAAAKALGDPTRLAVAWALRDAGTACVCDLAWIVGRDEKLVSHHVRALRGGGLAASTRRGKMVMYELTVAGRALVAALGAAEVSA